jgi:hypothetical protein
MLSHTSIPGPTFKDPMVRVKVLVPFFMAGKQCDVGDTLKMLTSDAQAAAKGCVPPRVEII